MEILPSAVHLGNSQRAAAVSAFEHKWKFNIYRQKWSICMRVLIVILFKKWKTKYHTLKDFAFIFYLFIYSSPASLSCVLVQVLASFLLFLSLFPASNLPFLSHFIFVSFISFPPSCLHFFLTSFHHFFLPVFLSSFLQVL